MPLQINQIRDRLADKASRPDPEAEECEHDGGHDEKAPETIFSPRSARIGWKKGTRPAIYMAGKISKNCWRHAMIPGLRNSEEDFRPIEFLSRFSYVGPFFNSCDHGCAHGPSKHGFGAGGYKNCNTEWSPRTEVAKLCMKSLKRANVVFVWVCPEFLSAFGSLVEIGYARALGKHVVLCVHPSMTQARDIWFANEMADTVVISDDPADGFRKFVETQYEGMLTVPAHRLSDQEFARDVEQCLDVDVAWIDATEKTAQIGFLRKTSEAVRFSLRWSS